jgi:hypothetical protein
MDTAPASARAPPPTTPFAACTRTLQGTRCHLALHSPLPLRPPPPPPPPAPPGHPPHLADDLHRGHDSQFMHQHRPLLIRRLPQGLHQVLRTPHKGRQRALQEAAAEPRVEGVPLPPPHRALGHHHGLGAQQRQEVGVARGLVVLPDLIHLGVWVCGCVQWVTVVTRRAADDRRGLRQGRAGDCARSSCRKARVAAVICRAQ